MERKYLKGIENIARRTGTVADRALGIGLRASDFGGFLVFADGVLKAKPVEAGVGASMIAGYEVGSRARRFVKSRLNRNNSAQ